MGIRTDLADEAEELWRKSAGENTELPGVKAQELQKNGVRFYRVEILDQRGEKALGKPCGVYETMYLPGEGRPTPELVESLAESLGDRLDLRGEESVLVVGLGNRTMTPDAVGPLSMEGLLVTRHLRQHLPKIFSAVRSVSALAPGVLGTTGVESAEIVASVVGRTKPDRVLVVDALAAGGPDRLCQTIQVTDAGIVPGSGVGNSRAAFSKKSLGVPVVAVGAPTVMDSTLFGGNQEAPMVITPRDIDARVRRLSSLISAAINAALFPGWSHEEIAQFVE